MTDRYAWVAALEPDAPDIVAAWRGIDEGQFLSVRREVRRRSGDGSAPRTVEQLAATASALRDVVERLPGHAFAMPGGEGDWNVAEAVGHVATARAGLVLAASLAASDRWPPDAPTVVPGIPGPASADRDALDPPDRPEPAADRALGSCRSSATSSTGACSSIRSSDGSAAASGCSSPASTT